MKPFAQQTPLERTAAHNDQVKKAYAYSANSNAGQSASSGSGSASVDVEMEQARANQVANCEAAAADCARSGNSDMARLYELKAEMVAGSASATREYLALHAKLSNKSNSGTVSSSSRSSSQDYDFLGAITLLAGMIGLVLISMWISRTFGYGSLSFITVISMFSILILLGFIATLYDKFRLKQHDLSYYVETLADRISKINQSKEAEKKAQGVLRSQNPSCSYLVGRLVGRITHKNNCSEMSNRRGSNSSIAYRLGRFCGGHQQFIICALIVALAIALHKVILP